jgi:tetratricopeptide (TPR) repeat protein
LKHALVGLERWPEDPFFLREAAELLLGQNRSSEARQMARRFDAVAPADERAAAADLQARIALDSADSSALQQAVDRAVVLNPSSAAPLLLLAEWHQQQGTGGEHGRRALELLRRAVAAAPADAEAHAALGSVLAQRKEYDAAVVSLRRALTLSPRVLEGVPNVQLAQIYRRQGRRLEAEFHERRYRHLRRLKDGWANAIAAMRRDAAPGEYRTLGALALERYDNWIALCAFTRAVKAMPGDARSWRGLAAAQRRYGRFDEPVRAMRRAYLLEHPGSK